MSASATIGVSILGSTGSIGVSTLDVIARHPDRYRVIALTASTQTDRMLAQCRQVHPQVAVMRDAGAARQLRDALRAEGIRTEVLEGEAGLLEAARHPDAQVVMAAIVGAAGLLPTLAAVRAGRRVLLANKEPLVMSGHILMAEARRSGAVLLPIDSEHNAVFQCLPNDYRAGEPVRGVRRILLTCSGGPFRQTPVEQLATVTPEQACAHPNWSMGRKISVDSATLMNKGLEVIEACRLFAAHPDQVEVVIHPQSVIHSMVDYADGSVLAQLGNPDMRTPIAHALAWPERIDSGVKPLDLFQVAHLDFSAPDRARFPCLDLAYRAVRAGGTTPAILNAANEWAVNAFLERRIGFLDIPRVIAGVLDSVTPHPETEIDAILDDDRAARLAAGHIAHPQPPTARSSHA